MKKLIVLIILLLIAIAAIRVSSIKVISVVVKDKERIVEDSTSKYLVFTESEVFENTDALLAGKFNSSDIQGQLEVGKKYKIKVYGWRIPFLSMYRNIINIEK